MTDDDRIVTITAEHVRDAMGVVPKIVAALLVAEAVAGIVLSILR